MLTVGDKLPSFKVPAAVSVEPGSEFKPVSDTDFAGKWLVLYFYPKDFTFVCPTEIIEFDNALPAFAERGAVVVGGSTDNEFCHLAWRNSHPGLRAINHPLIHLTPQLASDLGVIRPGAGAALRVTFVIDPTGTIRAVTAYDLSVGRNVKEVLRTLDALQTEELTPCGWEKGQDTLSKKK